MLRRIYNFSNLLSCSGCVVFRISYDSTYLHNIEVVVNSGRPLPLQVVSE